MQLCHVQLETGETHAAARVDAQVRLFEVQGPPGAA